jgi:molecular chaperone GrpE
MTGKQQKEEDISLEEVIEEVEDQLAKDGVSAETDSEESTPEVTIESLSEQIEALKKTAADNLDKAVRAQAELDNVRKRTTRDVENAHKYALDKFINELLPVLDSMELGIVASVEGEDVSSLREGLELTLKMFCSSLEKSGVHPVNPQKGDKFNPDQHEAVTMQEVDDAESGTIVTMLQKGYELNGRLIRPAMVIVAK